MQGLNGPCILISIAFSPGTQESSECYNKTMFMIIRPTTKPLIDMGMNNSATQLIASSTWTQVLNMVVRSGFPNTQILNNALLISGPGNISGTFFGTFTQSGTGAFQFRAVRTRNGVDTILATGNRDVATSFTDSVLAGDLISLWGYSTNGVYRTIDSSAYIYFNRVV